MIMSLLKQATLRHHHEVEALMPVLNPALSETTYAQVLRQLHGVIQPLETHLLTLPIPADVELNLRLKTPLLARDLEALAQDLPPPVTLAPLLLGVPEALGALYVLEGATLGGQVIARHLRRTLGVTAERGGAYFSGYGSRTGRMWQAFGDAMDRVVIPGDEAHVILGAQIAFQAFGDALRGVPAWR